jgi:DNA ligase-associated metallophosphoesterase
MLICLGEIQALLLADRAVWLPESSSLLIADLHLGKAHSFRRQAVPVPAGTSNAVLARLDRLVDLVPARELVILGDFLHGPLAQRSQAIGLFRDWRARHLALDLHLVRGNHDASAGDPPADCGLIVHEGVVQRSGLCLAHEPTADLSPPPRFSVAGHIHPVFRLAGAIDRVRLPCFWLRAGTLILPAFGEFTGGWAVRPAPADRVFVTDGSRVLEVPAAR